MTHAIHFLSAALEDVPNSICDSQLAAIEAVSAIFSNWKIVDPSSPVYPTVVTPPPPPKQSCRCQNHLGYATLHPLPRVTMAGTG